MHTSLLLPKISIITPSFNQGKFIKQTIDSVLDQDYPNLEYIVVDGGSSDDTVSILKQYDKKIKWISEKDNGQTEAINKGIKMSSGEVIAYLNSDDYYLPGSLLIVGRCFAKNKKCLWLSGDYKIINENGSEIQPFVRWYKSFLRLIPTVQMLFIANFIAQPSTFWKRDLTTRIGLFDESLKYVMDYEYWLRIIKLYTLSVIKQPLSCFRIHSLSKGNSQYKKQFDEELNVVKKYCSTGFLITLHSWSNKLIVSIYNFIKH